MVDCTYKVKLERDKSWKQKANNDFLAKQNKVKNHLPLFKKEGCFTLMILFLIYQGD